MVKYVSWCSIQLQLVNFGSQSLRQFWKKSGRRHKLKVILVTKQKDNLLKLYTVVEDKISENNQGLKLNTGYLGYTAVLNESEFQGSHKYSTSLNLLCQVQDGRN